MRSNFNRRSDKLFRTIPSCLMLSAFCLSLVAYLDSPAAYAQPYGQPGNQDDRQPPPTYGRRPFRHPTSGPDQDGRNNGPPPMRNGQGPPQDDLPPELRNGRGPEGGPPPMNRNGLPEDGMPPPRMRRGREGDDGQPPFLQNGRGSEDGQPMRRRRGQDGMPPEGGQGPLGGGQGRPFDNLRRDRLNMNDGSAMDKRNGGTDEHVKDYFPRRGSRFGGGANGAGMRAPGGGGLFGKKPLDFSMLNLTDEQKAKIQQIRSQNGSTARKIQQSLREQHQQFRDLMFDPKASDDVIRAKRHALRVAQDRIEEAQLNDFLSIRKVLTPEQRQRFAEIKSSEGRVAQAGRGFDGSGGAGGPTPPGGPGLGTPKGPGAGLGGGPFAGAFGRMGQNGGSDTGDMRRMRRRNFGDGSGLLGRGRDTTSNGTNVRPRRGDSNTAPAD